MKFCITSLLTCLLAVCIAGGEAETQLRLRSPAALSENLRMGVPCVPDVVIDRGGFAVGYSNRHRQALWVCYHLTAEQLKGRQVKRSGKFRADPLVKFRPVHPREYDRTGFDRGHLAPAADMSYSQQTMEHSFFMSNISPQLPGCNRGIWKRLETLVRYWAKREQRLYVITGPVLVGAVRTMGDTEITVPDAFYKVLLDMTPPFKMIGFLVPNRASRRPVRAFAVTVDEVEATTGMDFFNNLEESLEAMLERQAEINDWGAPPQPVKTRKNRPPLRHAGSSPAAR